MSFAYCILTGKRIQSKVLSRLQSLGVFKHHFWAEYMDLEHYIQSSLFNTGGVRILPGTSPVEAYGKAFFNIMQTSDPFALFGYFLNKRHFFCSFANTFDFSQQCMLEEYSRKMGFQHNIWLPADRFLYHYRGNFSIQSGSSWFNLPPFPFPLINIDQTNNPLKLKSLIRNSPKSILSGKELPCAYRAKLHDYQMKKGFSISLWLNEYEATAIDTSIRADAEGIGIQSPKGKPMHFFNIEELEDPLAAHKMHCQSRSLLKKCVDVHMRAIFSRNEVISMRAFRQRNRLRSRCWAQPAEIAAAGGILRDGEVGKTVRCSNGEWHCMGQVLNFRETLQRLKENRARNPKHTHEALTVLDNIMSD